MSFSILVYEDRSPTAWGNAKRLETLRSFPGFIDLDEPEPGVCRAFYWYDRRAGLQAAPAFKAFPDRCCSIGDPFAIPRPPDFSFPLRAVQQAERIMAPLRCFYWRLAILRLCPDFFSPALLAILLNAENEVYRNGYPWSRDFSTSYVVFLSDHVRRRPEEALAVDAALCLCPHILPPGYPSLLPYHHRLAPVSRKQEVFLAYQRLLAREFEPDFFPHPVCPSQLRGDPYHLLLSVCEDANYQEVPILADALEESGYRDHRLLAHLRDTSITHGHGCWAIWHLLGCGVYQSTAWARSDPQSVSWLVKAMRRLCG